MSGHVVLIGDFIFDNASYVPDGPSVIEHLRDGLPAGWRATLKAEDGAVMDSVAQQLEHVPDDATHLVLSVGTNDTLRYEDHLATPATSTAEWLATVAEIRDEFSSAYRRMLDGVRATGLPVAACTIYDAVPGMSRPESVVLAVLNGEITRHVLASGTTLIDLRLVCDEATDYGEASPIEPSASGGRKIAAAVRAAVFDTERACRVVGRPPED